MIEGVRTQRQDHDRFGVAGFAALARARLAETPLPGLPSHLSPSDFDLNPNDWHPAPELKPAAVLVGIVAREPLTLLLTQRASTLSNHAGQIAFPGGRVDPGDATPLAAALREAEEEVGLTADFVTPLGFLDTYRTGTGYAIVPLVALIRPGFSLRLQEAEVAEAFEVPFAYLMDHTNHETHTKIWQGAERRFYAMPYEDRYIWGATAGILKNMHERLFAQ
jgi:8-oxo-dGTP pyrophosphatase MutT (NUDIX family)